MLTVRITTFNSFVFFFWKGPVLYSNHAVVWVLSWSLDFIDSIILMDIVKFSYIFAIHIYIYILIIIWNYDLSLLLIAWVHTRRHPHVYGGSSSKRNLKMLKDFFTARIFFNQILSLKNIRTNMWIILLTLFHLNYKCLRIFFLLSFSISIYSV